MGNNRISAGSNNLREIETTSQTTQEIYDELAAGYRDMIAAGTMDSATWKALSPQMRDKVRDNSDLTPQLIGLEGRRVEVIEPDQESVLPNRRKGGKRTFIIGKSTGWRPCHLEVANTRSMGGVPAAKHYDGLRSLGNAR